MRRSVLKEKLPELAEEYAKEIFKKSKRFARRFKRTEKYPNYAAHAIGAINCSEELEPVKKWGILPDEDEIAKIKNIAFRKGVEFYLKKAETIKSINPERAEHLRNVAKRNAELLERNIS